MTEAVVSSRRRLPVIWLVPVLAVVLGIYMVIYTFMTEGPEITIALLDRSGDRGPVEPRSAPSASRSGSSSP